MKSENLNEANPVMDPNLPEKSDQMSPQQRKHQDGILLTFMSYERLMTENHPGSSLYQNSKRLQNVKYYQLIQQKKRQKFEQAVRANQEFLNQIVNFCEGQERLKIVEAGPVSFDNFSKVKTTVKQFYREWCDEGPEVKDYKMLVEKAKLYLKKGDKVLAPGCGLGRLVLEFVEAGFGCQGNEVSYFMLYGSNFILNCVQEEKSYRIYPFISSTDYYRNEDDIFRSVLIPDKAACKVVTEDSEFSMAGGQFIEVYSRQPSSYDCVTTCFFIDTANNIFDYINTIHTILKPSGIWINYGPLLFHYREVYKEVSIEVSWEVLREYIEERFDFLEEQIKETTYCHDERSEMGIKYNCITFLCRKK